MPDAPAMDHKTDLKALKPKTFNRDRNELKSWVMYMDLYFRLHDVPEGRKTLVTVNYLTGKAAAWITPKLESYLDDNNNPGNMFTEFSSFKDEIDQIFRVTNEETTAERIIQVLKQRASAAEYAAVFQKYADMTSWDDDVLMTVYKRGLKDEVKDEMLYQGKDLENL